MKGGVIILAQLEKNLIFSLKTIVESLVSLAFKFNNMKITQFAL